MIIGNVKAVSSKSVKTLYYVCVVPAEEGTFKLRIPVLRQYVRRSAFPPNAEDAGKLLSKVQR